MEADLIPKTPLERAEERVNKEHQDVEQSLEAIHEVLIKMYIKQEKIDNASTGKQKKLYKKQLKNTGKYLTSLFKSLELEMIEHALADYALIKLQEEV